MSARGPLSGLSAYYALLAHWHFRGLLAALLAVLFIQPVVTLLPGGGVLMTLLHAAIFSGSFWAVGAYGAHGAHGPRGGWVGQALVAVWAALGVVAELAPSAGADTAAALAAVPLTVALAWSTFAALFLVAKADLDALAGAIFGYFMLALLFGTLFRAIELVQPGSFTLSGADDAAGEFLYLSLVTITTLGYGDVLPVSPTARMLAGVEAAVGTLYIAILIGRIVGALKPSPRREQGSDAGRSN